MDGKNETGRNKIKAHYSESSKFRQSPCLAEQGFPILASFPLRRPPHPRKMGECAVSGGARHSTLTKKRGGWGLAERIGKPCSPLTMVALIIKQQCAREILVCPVHPDTGERAPQLLNHSFVCCRLQL